MTQIATRARHSLARDYQNNYRVRAVVFPRDELRPRRFVFSLQDLALSLTRKSNIVALPIFPQYLLHPNDLETLFER